jgi:hypothetical protein
MLEWLIRRNLQARDDLKPDICDVFYDDFLADPVAVVRRIYTHFALPWPDGHERHLRDYLQANPQGKHGPHRHALSDFDLTPDEVHERFAPYTQRFGPWENAPCNDHPKSDSP